MSREHELTLGAGRVYWFSELVFNKNAVTLI